MENTTPRINISFTKDDYDLFHEIIKESQLTYVPASVLVRNYMRKGMQVESTSSIAHV